MPRYDDSPSGHRSGGHSPMDRRNDRRIKSPLNERRRRDSPLPSVRNMGSRDAYDDYRVKDHSSHHRSNDSNSSSMPYKILCVSNISNKISDNAVRESLTREFQRFGEPNVKLVYDDNTRLAYIYFRNYEDARDARHAKSRLVLFDKTIIIDPMYERSMQMNRRRSLSPDYQRGSMRGGAGPPSPPMQRRPPPPPIRNHMNDKMYMQPSHRENYRDMHNMRGDYHHSGGGGGGGGGGGSGNRQQHRESKKEKFPNYLHHIPPEEDDKATRTLFIGNLEVTITDADLRRIFERYGVVEDIDVKRPPPGQGNAYAFIKFLNLDMAHRAKVEMSGQYIGKFQCKIGYGKATPTTRIWVGGLGPWTSLSHLEREFDRFGAIRKIDFVKGDNHAYIQYDTIDAAQAACQEMRGFPLGGHDKRLRVDFADPGPYSFIASPRNNAGAAGDQYAAAPQRRNEGEEWPANPHTSKFPGNNAEFNEFDRNAAQPKSREFGDDVRRDRGDYQQYSGNNANWDQVWPEGGQYSPSSDRRVRRPRTPDGEPDRKRARRMSASPNAGEDRNALSSPRRSRGGDSLDANETNGKDENPKMSINENVSSVQELVKCCPPAWNGGLILKNSAFPARMLYCSGDLQLVDLLMKDSNSDQSMLRITQRLRLDKAKTDDVTRRMNIAGSSGYCMLLTTQGSAAIQLTAGQTSEDGSAIQQRPLRNLVTYLKQKDAAGVVSVAKDGKELGGVLYAFPPCLYAMELLHRIAPNLSPDTTTKEDYLVVVVVRNL